MRFPFSIALSATFITVLFAEWPEENLFDISDSLEETLPSYPTDDSLQNLFQSSPVATDPPEDSFSLAQGCTSSSSDELMRKVKIRRREGTCPSLIFPGDLEGFNMERMLRGKIQELQDRAQRDKRVLPFCPPPTLPLCCIGEPEYLGVQVHDCQLCMSTNSQHPNFACLCSSREIIELINCSVSSTIDNPLIWSCLDFVNIFCCSSYGVSSLPFPHFIASLPPFPMASNHKISQT